MRKVYYIDLFCGAGGTSTGVHLDGNAEVILCINHDVNAIKSHEENHPKAKHFTEDIRTVNMDKITDIVNHYRTISPGCVINLWASLECTNFSNAKGGMEKDADSRTLALDLDRYIQAIKPDYIFIENVREFMSWGPLDKNNKPISKDKGVDYLKWVETIKGFGYNYDYKLLNSADFGAYTARLRYFGQFVSKNNTIAWPEQTHSKTSISNLKKWKAVRDVLDLDDEGQSIFSRKKPLVDNTLRKILAGLDKFAVNGEDHFTMQYNGNGTDSQHRVHSTNDPITTITTNNRHALVSSQYLIKYYGTGVNAVSIQSPSPTIGTVDTCAKVSCLMMNYGNSSSRSLDRPAATVLNNDKHNLITALLFNPQWGGSTHSIDKPAFTIIARMDKAPPHLIITKKGIEGIKVLETDTAMMVELKTFMVENGIVDVKTRMLKISELLQIQGFPKDYKLIGTQKEQKKYIGNAVECNMAKAIARCNYETIQNFTIAA